MIITIGLVVLALLPLLTCDEFGVLRGKLPNLCLWCWLERLGKNLSRKEW